MTTPLRLDPKVLDGLTEVGRKFNKAVGKALLELNRRVSAMQQAYVQASLDPDWQSELRYQRTIERERRLARQYLDRLIVRTEQDLGLKPEFDPRRKATK